MQMEIDESLPNDENDPIVAEIPIILSKRLENQLFVFQYPLQPKARHKELNVRKCLIKPKNHEVKLEVGINVESPNFDMTKAEDLAYKIDGPPSTRKDDRDIVYENDIMDKVIYTSTEPLKNVSKYAVGIFNGKEYHITPLEGFLQLRPNFDHLNRNLKRKRTETDEEGSDEEEAGPSKAQQVTVRFARTSNERLKKAHENSYKSLMQKSSEEPWLECTWEKAGSNISELEKLKLYAQNTSEITQIGEISPEEYIRLLVPEDREQATMKPCLPANVLSLQDLRALPLMEQCKLLLKDAKIIQFQQLLLLLAGCEGLTPENLLKTLPQVAVLVRGNWIVKSELLYPSKTFSAISGVPSEQMCRARDYILYLFTKNQFVERRKVTSIVKLPNEEVKEIFTGISKLRFNKGWELLQPMDCDFMSKYPEVLQRQELMWEQRAKQLSEFSKEPKEKRQRHKSKSVSEDKGGTKKDGPLTSKDSDTDSGTEKSKGSPLVARHNKRARNNNSESNSKEENS